MAGNVQVPKSGVILNTVKRRVVRRGQKSSGGWLHSPAMFEFFLLALRSLLDMARARKVDLGAEEIVTMIRAARVEGDTRIFILPTDWDDPQGIPIKQVSSRRVANLYDFMAEAGCLVEVGHSERYALQPTKPEDPVDENALWFDVKTPLERKLNTQGRSAARTKAEKAEAKARAEAAAKARAEAAARAKSDTAAAENPNA
jgi:hypothetical protein